MIRRMQQAIPRRDIRTLRRGPRPGCDFAALAAALLEYPSSGALVLLLPFLEALAASAVIARQSVRRFEVEAVLK